MEFVSTSLHLKYLTPCLIQVRAEGVSGKDHLEIRCGNNGGDAYWVKITDTPKIVRLNEGCTGVSDRVEIKGAPSTPDNLECTSLKTYNSRSELSLLYSAALEDKVSMELIRYWV